MTFFDIVAKEIRDASDEELFKEVGVGLMIPTSPYLGLATDIFGAPRLISATSHSHHVAMGSMDWIWTRRRTVRWRVESHHWINRNSLADFA